MTIFLCKAVWINFWSMAFGARLEDLNCHSTFYQLNNARQVTYPLCSSISFSMKGNNITSSQSWCEGYMNYYCKVSGE